MICRHCGHRLLEHTLKQDGSHGICWRSDCHCHKGES